MQRKWTFTPVATGWLGWFACAVLLLRPAAVTADDPQIPSLHWTARSDWLNVKDMGAVGDGKADDTAAIQQALATMRPGSTLYLPADELRRLTPALDDLRRLGEYDLKINH